MFLSKVITGGRFDTSKHSVNDIAIVKAMLYLTYSFVHMTRIKPRAKDKSSSITAFTLQKYYI